MDQKEYREGLFMGGLAFIIWGLLPLYWKWVQVITPYQIFAQRVVWSLLFVLIIMAFKGVLNDFYQIVRQARNWRAIIGPAIVISINWLTYIWAVNNGYVIETSLGYYINPLVLTFLGGVFFKERLTRLQTIGIGFAGSGVLIKTLLYGKVPFIALFLAVSFATYGLLKKKSQWNALNGLGFETLVISIPSFIYLVYAEKTHIGITGNLPGYFWGVIALSGAFTAIPLLLYAGGTKRLPLSVVGFLQYIAPTLMLVLGVFVFGEPFGRMDILPFLLIWIGLCFFTYSQYKILTVGSRVRKKGWNDDKARIAK